MADTPGSAGSATGHPPGWTTSLRHEETLLNPQTVDVTRTARREFSLFIFHTVFLVRGGTQLESTTVMVKFPRSKLVNG